jgi:hypothetical protein
MSKAMLLVVFLLPACLWRAEAAPAPLPRPQACSEAAFDARTPERGRAVAAFLRSRYFLRWANSHPKIKAAMPQLKGAELEGWLKANLIAANDGASVRVRLRGVRSLGLLEAVSDELTGKGRPAEDERTRQERMIRQLEILLVDMEETGRRNDAQALSGWGMVEDEPLKVQSAPRALRGRR